DRDRAGRPPRPPRKDGPGDRRRRAAGRWTSPVAPRASRGQAAAKAGFARREPAPASGARRAMPRSRAFCAEVSRETAEPLAATASRVDHWIVIEYRGLWGHHAVDASGLSAEGKAHRRARAAGLGRAKILFVRQTERRHGPLRVFWARSSENGSRLSGAEIEGYDELRGLDFGSSGEALRHPLLLVCTHGKH